MPKKPVGRWECHSWRPPTTVYVACHASNNQISCWQHVQLVGSKIHAHPDHFLAPPPVRRLKTASRSRTGWRQFNCRAFLALWFLARIFQHSVRDPIVFHLALWHLLPTWDMSSRRPTLSGGGQYMVQDEQRSLEAACISHCALWA